MIADWIPALLYVPNLQRPIHDSREIFNAIRYRMWTGTAWRSVPHDFPPRSTVMKRSLQGRQEGVFDRLDEELVHAVRKAEGKDTEPSAGLVDSQSVLSTDVGGPRGFDAGKKGEMSPTSRARRRAWLALGGSDYTCRPTGS